MTFRVLTIFGTRPEAIKLAPVVKLLEKDPRFISRICVTSQHYELLEQALEAFEIEPDHDLGVMAPNQGLHELTSAVLLRTKTVVEEENANIVVVQGDTTTAFTASLSAFYCKVPIAHVEAGLRTGDLSAPYPEEANRLLVSRLADIHFCPTETNRTNLLREDVSERAIVVTGNTGIDALLMVREKVRDRDPREWAEQFGPALGAIQDRGKRLILVTGHRREHFGPGFRSICKGIRYVAERFPEVAIVYPVHLNPNVRQPVLEILSSVGNIHLVEPVAYSPFVYLMNRAHFILSDSGGIQEEAPSLGKPVLVMRALTERPEAVAAGSALLVGADVERIAAESARLLEDPNAYDRMARVANPFGDGHASERIVDALYRFLKGPPRAGPRVVG
ncbi:MAG: non-hydrolyzing UDP-N-acetylglucosamine 2-epimerase [Phycisphaerae bacterium]